jgi:hypothetical protein
MRMKKGNQPLTGHYLFLNFYLLSFAWIIVKSDAKIQLIFYIVLVSLIRLPIYQQKWNQLKKMIFNSFSHIKENFGNL